jgi:hypothetical protein
VAESNSGDRRASRGTGLEPPWLQVDFGVDRPLTQVTLYFLDDGNGPSVEAVGEEERAGYPLVTGSSTELAGLPALPPVTYQIQQWDGEGWREVRGQTRDPEDPAGRRANTVTFPEIRTSRIRVVLHPRVGSTTGLTELEAWGPAPPHPEEPTGPVANLALNRSREGVPRASASYTYRGDSPWEAVDGRMTLNRYSRNRWTAFGSTNRVDWLEVELSRREEVSRVDLFLFGDGGGVAAPEAYRVEYWAGSSWEEVQGERRDPGRPLAWAMNRVEFDPIETDRLRVVLRHAAPYSSGLAEIRIFQ